MENKGQMGQALKKFVQVQEKDCDTSSIAKFPIVGLSNDVLKGDVNLRSKCIRLNNSAFTNSAKSDDLF